MTKKDKELLFKDLSARLPYGVKVEIKYYDDVWGLLAIYTNGTTYATRDIGYPIETYFEDCKPYLFPLSSMTEEQKRKLKDLISQETKIIIEQLKNDDCGIDEGKYHFNKDLELEWLLKNHFDYRGLIPMGLAEDATGLNVY